MKENFKQFRELEKISNQSVISLKGTIKKSELKNADKEIEIKKLEILNLAESPLPIDLSGETTNIDKRIDHRFLDLRREKTLAIFKNQSEITSAFREFFKNSNFIEIQTPSIIGSSSEGGTELFPVKYFEKNAYLAQSPQLYKQMCAISIEKVFTISPVWRAEKHNTPRHLNESRQMDIEVAFVDEFEIMKYMEKSIEYMIKKVKENSAKELKILNVQPKVPKAKYLSYKETLSILKKNKINIKYGEDLTPESEEKLNKLFPYTVCYIHSWPSTLKPFYIWPKENGISGGFDAIYGGMEISSGGQRVHVPKILEKQLKEKGLNPKDFKSYIDSFRYGSPIHSGWSIGLERFTMILVGAKNIRECCLFPRDRDRLTP